MRKEIFLRIIFCVFFFTTCHVGEGVALNFKPAKSSDYQVLLGESPHNYLPGSLMQMRITFRNKTLNQRAVNHLLMVVDSLGNVVWDTAINLDLSSKQTISFPMLIPVPKSVGRYHLTTSKDGAETDSSALSFAINVLTPSKSDRLSKILVHTPDEEVELGAFLNTYEIKAPMLSWGQVLLLGKRSWMRYVNGEAEMVQLIDRSLKREMSVIFIDFVPVSDSILDEHAKVKIPFDLTLRFNKVKSPERRFMLKRETRELTHGFIGNYFDSWNGLNGITVPPVDLRFDGKGVTINAFAIAGNKPPRYPVVELVPDQDSGKLYFCQLLTDGRLDPAVKPMRNHPEKAAYDPMAVQFLLNLISASVGDNLLK